MKMAAPNTDDELSENPNHLLNFIFLNN